MAPLSSGDGNTSAMYAGSYDNANASVMAESPAGNALNAVASTLLNAKAVRLEGEAGPCFL